MGFIPGFKPASSPERGTSQPVPDPEEVVLWLEPVERQPDERPINADVTPMDAAGQQMNADAPMPGDDTLQT